MKLCHALERGSLSVHHAVMVIKHLILPSVMMQKNLINAY